MACLALWRLRQARRILCFLPVAAACIAMLSQRKRVISRRSTRPFRHGFRVQGFGTNTQDSKACLR